TKEIGSRRRHRTIVRGAKNHDIFASDDTFVYWGSWQPRGKGQVSRVRVAGGREEVLATELRSPVGVAVVGNQLAVANKGEDTILLVDLPR
ncbi:MAG: hypothetical protein KJO07_01220, partial [Deltaproteobacteria bacterium]|nr:hypothetical protein [Deltaproteobacteria bacterium]